MGIKEILYFDKSERKNTDEMVKFAKKRIDELGIKHVVIVWSSGYTLRKFQEVAKGAKLNIVTVTNPHPDSVSRGTLPIMIRPTDSEEEKKRKEELISKGITEQSVTISNETREELEKEGIKVCYLNDDLMLGEPLALGNEQTSRRARLEPFGLAPHIRPLDIDAGTDLSLLTIISQGFRVCVGCTVLAVKYGHIPEGEMVCAIGGVSTALILRAGSRAKTCIVKEIIGYERGSSHFERNPDRPEGD
jgi:hypothetical protein